MTRTIVIDPGHGGNAPVGGSSPNNATGPTGLLEKSVTLDLGTRISTHPALLSYKVLLTRDRDINVGIKDRAGVARSNNAAVFVSLHLNGNASSTIQGSEAWIGNGSSANCQLLARGVLDRLVAANGLRNRGVKTATSNEYGVVNPANHLPTTAHTLVEVSFLTDPVEENRLKTSAYLDSIAGAIAVGIDDYLKMKSGSVAPLHYAVRSGSVSTLRALLAATPDLEAKDQNAMTPLMIASHVGDATMVRMLIKAGASTSGKRSKKGIKRKTSDAAKTTRAKRKNKKRARGVDK